MTANKPPARQESARSQAPAGASAATPSRAYSLGYIALTMAATLAVLGGIVYGGYRIYAEQSLFRERVGTFNPPYLQIAQSLATDEQYADAEAVFEHMLEENPVDLYARSWLACCYNAQGKYEEAAVIYESLRAGLTPPSDLYRDTLYFLACARASQGDANRALEAFSSYLFWGGGYPRADRTFKVTWQLDELAQTQEFQDLLTDPALEFRYFRGSRMLYSPDGRELGELYGSVKESSRDLATLDFFEIKNQDVNNPDWTLHCYIDREANVFRARYSRRGEEVQDFVGTIKRAEIEMYHRQPASEGEAAIVTKLEWLRDAATPGRSDLRLLRLTDGSDDWSRAEVLEHYTLIPQGGFVTARID